MKRVPALRRRQGERNHAVLMTASPDAYAGLERIKQLEARFARASVDSREHRRLAAAIRIEAIVYRKSLDASQAAAMRGREPRLAAESESPTRTWAAAEPATARRGTTRRRPRATDA
jgi:hypothetical protein